jgi:hypothetical protein
MQYLITQEEFDKLKADTAERPSEKMIATLQDLCTKVSDHMPIKFWGREEATPWGCILTKKGGYCDECPVKSACPYKYKEYSK